MAKKVKVLPDLLAMLIPKKGARIKKVHTSVKQVLKAAGRDYSIDPEPYATRFTLVAEPEGCRFLLADVITEDDSTFRVDWACDGIKPEDLGSHEWEANEDPETIALDILGLLLAY